ncbi:hypothetical protein BgiMline_035309, partial [Biomphalaria glabrata]
LSSAHDGSTKDCSDLDQYIMATTYAFTASKPSQGSYWMFSNCSIAAIKDFLG